MKVKDEVIIAMEDSGIDSDPKTAIGQNVKFEDNGSDSSNSSFNGGEEPAAVHMQRKLEQKISDGKKLRRGQVDYKKLNTGPNLIPIQRLSIPSKLTPSKEQLPLVEWDSDESEEDIHFFPVNKTSVKTELTDNFSLEEFDVSPDEDDLNLLPPKPIYRKLFNCPMSAKCTII